MKFLNKKQIILTILGLSLVLFLASVPALTKADVNSPASSTAQNAGVLTNWVGAKVIGGVVYVVNYIIGFIGGVLFNIAGGLVNFSLSLNFDILNNPMIGVGWGIVRDLTNLGFVLFIIIIAIATILRFQEYGVKNTLGKLIAVALLVNFSLFFAGIMIDFSNMLTNYFVQGINSNGNLGTALAGAFKIQNLLKVKDAAEMQGLMQGFMDNIGSPTLIGIASIFFVAAFTFLGALSLLALAVMFLIRLIALAILLVVVPMACLFWILPATRNLWNQWWSQFMKWIIFAPAASFFLYLAVYMVVNYGKVIDSLAKSAQGIGTTNQMNFASLVINDPLKQIGNMVIVIGLLLGGLLAANSMGIHGSKAFIGMAGATGNWLRGKVGKMGARAGTWPARTELGRKAIEGMQKTKFGPVRFLGTALSNVGIAQGEKMARQAEERQKGLSDKQLALRVAGMGHEERIAALSRLTKNRTLDLVPDLARYVRDPGTKKLFGNYGQGKEYEDLEKTAGFNTAMLTAKTTAERQKAAEIFRESYTIKDYDKLQGDVFGAKPTYGLQGAEQTDIANILRESMFDKHPGAISKVRTKLKGKDLGEFQAKLDEYIDKFEKSNLPNEIQGIEVPIKVKIDFITKNKPLFSNWARGIYNSRKNFAGSLFGSAYASERGEGAEKTT